MRNKRRIVIFAIVLLGMIIGIVCMNSKMERGLFSWEKDTIENSEKLFADMKQLGITEVYQYMPVGVEPEAMKEYLVEAKEYGMDVYYLTGEPDWVYKGLEGALIKEIDTVVAMNQSAGEAAFKGIVFDVEPQALDEWQKEADKLIKSYVNNMKKAYEYALAKGITMILCIPYHYDIAGYGEELETLIAEACDGVAIMNYYRDREITNMQTEAVYAHEYDKFVITIYEMKEVGTHGITEKNTYHELGFESVIENFRELHRAFRGQRVKMAYHDYEAVKEVMQNK